MVAAVKRVALTLWGENQLLTVGIARSFGDSFDIHGVQIDLWLILTQCEKRLSRLKRRHKRRSKRWKRLKAAVSGQTREAHLGAMRWQEQVLQDRVSIVKQIGDALVWNLAKGDPRFVQPLYRPSTHQLPGSPATDAYFRILEAAQQSGEYDAVLTDLTRCCGIGDVLNSGPAWPHPSPFEVKVKTQADGSLLTALFGNSITFQLDPEELARFTETFGSRAAEPVPFDRRGERQKGEVNEETHRTFEHFKSAVQHAAPVVRRNWRSLEGVLERAASGVCGCDLAETGLAYVGLPLKHIDPPRLRNTVWELLGRAGLEAEEDEWDVWPSYGLLLNDSVSATALPFLLWKIAPELRAVLITGDALLVTAHRKHIWREAFQRCGVEWRPEGETWRLSGWGNHLIYDASDVQRLQTGLAYSGISPSAVAQYAAMNLQHPDHFEVQRYRRSNDEPMEWYFFRKPDSWRGGSHP